MKFGTTAATGVLVVSNTSITAVAPAGTGTVDVTVINPSYTSAAVAADKFTYLTPQLISFSQPTTPAYITNGATLVATGGGSGNPVTFSLISGPATLSGTNNSSITYTGTGTVIVAANQAGNSSYAAAPQVTRTVTVSPESIFVVNGGGSVASLYPNGSSQSAAASGGGVGAAVDAAGYVWSLNTNGNGLTKFNNTGATAGTYSGNGTAAATALAIDGSGNVFVSNGNGTINAVNNAGTSPFGTPIAAAAGISSPSAISIDTAGSLWVASAGDGSVVEIIGVVAPVTTPTVAAVKQANPGTRP